ncbi:MAG TPA: N-acetylmuramoyl-L-alanine amidase [Myxococcota bacterium]|nr:N-acetylmuramoyl-L-alanine amidase [Myxococcota bacterium]
MRKETVVLSCVFGLFVGGPGCGGKVAETAETASSTAPAPDDGGGGAKAEDGAGSEQPQDGLGRVVLAGSAPVDGLVLEPYGVEGVSAVKPDAQGRVKAGIYKVPGGSYIAVPEGGTVRVRPDEARGIMIGGLPFQLDTEVKLVAESDPESLSFVRDVALAPQAMPAFGPRFLAPGRPIEDQALLGHRDHIRKMVLHADVSADARAGYDAELARALSSHFYIDFDGTLYQALDVGLAAYHAGEANQESVGVVLNNRLANLERSPDAKAHPRLLPEGASPTPPADAVAPDGPCRLEAGEVRCELSGQAFGLELESMLLVGRDGTWTSSDGEHWSSIAAPPLTVHGVREALGNHVAFGAAGKVAVSEDAASWRLVETGSDADWRDAFVHVPDGDGGAIVVLVGDRGAIARSTDSGLSFARVESGFAGNLEAVSQALRGRLIARGGDQAVVSEDQGATWRALGPADGVADVRAVVPAPGMGRCVGRLPQENESCMFWWSESVLPFVTAFAKVGELGLAYTRTGYAVTGDGGLSFESAVTKARAEELTKYERPVSERMTINGARVRAYGYTEPQYEALGSLARLLANVFPALKRVGALDEQGEVREQAFDVPQLESGILGHWHLESNRWDPGPGFEWQRLVSELAETAR